MVESPRTPAARVRTIARNAEYSPSHERARECNVARAFCGVSCLPNVPATWSVSGSNR